MMFIAGSRDPADDPSPAARAAARRFAATLFGAVERRDGGGTGVPFGYLAVEAPPTPDLRDSGRRLEALAEALTDVQVQPVTAVAELPLVYPLLGRFLDNEMAAPASTIPAAGPARRRAEVEATLLNRRAGALRFDGLYRLDLGDGPLARKLEWLMREPQSPARMRLDRPEPTAGAEGPTDGGADLLRLGRLLSEDPALGVTPAEIAAAPPPLRDWLAPGGRIDPRTAIVGEPRSDSSLITAQLHVAMLRFHNRVAEWLAETGGAAPERLAEATRALVRWHLQWLTLNDYLPRICDAAVLARVRRVGAPLYAGLRARMAGRTGGGLPVPLEYWAAASRWRHSATRVRWDLNRFHGRPDGGPDQLTPRAGMDLLLLWSGASMPTPRVPTHMLPDWSRLVESPPAFADRAARRIDTFLAIEGGEAVGAGPEVFRRLALMCLRHGHALNLPSGQDLAAAFNRVYDGLVRPLTEAQLTAGHTGEAVRDGFAERTPLWFYVLKEAEVQQGGLRLGQLGSALVAETLVGLIAQDPDSVWARRGRDGGPWSPADGARPDGLVIDELAALFRAAELL